MWWHLISIPNIAHILFFLIILARGLYILLIFSKNQFWLCSLVSQRSRTTRRWCVYVCVCVCMQVHTCIHASTCVHSKGFIKWLWPYTSVGAGLTVSLRLLSLCLTLEPKIHRSSNQEGKINIQWEREEGHAGDPQYEQDSMMTEWYLMYFCVLCDLDLGMWISYRSCSPLWWKGRDVGGSKSLLLYLLDTTPSSPPPHKKIL